MIYIVYNMASWLINWPGALGFYLQPITLLHYDKVYCSFFLVDTTVVATNISICQHARLHLLLIIDIYT